jgi:predicted negative regulator of RcsB-dependent stress response
MYKLALFIASVMTLSWFFAGWRQVQEAFNLPNCLLLSGGTLSTIFLLGVQGYWVYFEEKQKGTLKKRIALFETIHEALNARQASGRDCKKA